MSAGNSAFWTTENCRLGGTGEGPGAAGLPESRGLAMHHKRHRLGADTARGQSLHALASSDSAQFLETPERGRKEADLWPFAGAVLGVE